MLYEVGNDAQKWQCMRRNECIINPPFHELIPVHPSSFRYVESRSRDDEWLYFTHIRRRASESTPVGCTSSAA